MKRNVFFKRRTTSSSVTGFQLSISWHLGIAFCAVCVLAIMANLIAEHGKSMIKALHASPAIVHVVTHADAIATPPIANAEPLLLALNNFVLATRARVQAEHHDATTSLKQARIALRDELATYSASLPSATSSDLQQQVSQLIESGDKLVSLADSRRGAWARYSTHAEAMSDRVKQSLESAFKLFGRVLARQSLIDLGNQLDDIRRHFTALAASQQNDPALVTSLLKSEQAFTTMLQKHRKKLSRSEGDAWLTAMDSDFAEVTAASATLDHAMHQWRKTDDALRKLEADARRLVTASTTRSSSQSEDLPPQAISVSPQAATVDSQTSASDAESNTVIATSNDRSELVAWVSGATVLLVLLIGVRTVRGIATPIRELLAGIDKVGSGKTPKLLASGSITELNELVTAFNTMSDELIAARETSSENQHQLELKVRERTRELQQLAAHDPLTSLPNRRQLFELLETDLTHAEQAGHLVGIFFLDIDNFKTINDSMDHTYGDRVLREVAERLRDTVGAQGFAARLGGDEFTFVLSRAAHIDEVAMFGEQVKQAFDHGIKMDHRELMVSVSIGASVYPVHGTAPDALLKAADSAVYRAKSLGRNQLLMFTPDLLEIASHHFTVEQGLRRAIRNNEFELVFQPEINANTLEVDLVEALIRWRMADGRLATPTEFLSIAEESGLIMEISDWVLRTAIATAADWHHGSWPSARVAINVSPRQVMDDGFVENVASLLSEFNLPAACIEIELTENVLQTGPKTLEALLRLRQLGIAIALDDFGSGYSTLASLEQLPLTRIKIDRSLIASIDTNERSLAIARAIIGLCHGLGIEITAEGIERPEQFALLTVYRAMHLQGYLFARPLRHHDVIPALQTVSQSAQLQLLTMPHVTRHANVIELAPPTRAVAKAAG